jgi:DNA-binding transcriptional ArsR family regulator
MKEEVPFGHCATVLAALAAPERLRIIFLLRTKPHSVGQIAEELAIPQVNLSHHLAVLRRAGLLCGQKKGRFVLYSLAPGLLQTDGQAGGTEHLDLGCCRLEVPTLAEPKSSRRGRAAQAK